MVDKEIMEQITGLIGQKLEGQKLLQLLMTALEAIFLLPELMIQISFYL